MINAQIEWEVCEDARFIICHVTSKDMPPQKQFIHFTETPDGVSINFPAFFVEPRFAGKMIEGIHLATQMAERLNREKGLREHPGFPGHRVIGKFIPQWYINDDHAFDMPDKACGFDCTLEVLNMGKDMSVIIEDASSEADELVPYSVLITHDGPYRVEVQEAIKEFWSE